MAFTNSYLSIDAAAVIVAHKVSHAFLKFFPGKIVIGHVATSVVN